MMKWIKATMLRPVVFFLTILFTAAPGAAWADNVPADRTILKIHTYPKFAVIKFSPAFANDLGCGSGSVADTYAAIMWENDPDEKAKYASVLMAMAGNMKIGLGISGCFPNWGGGIPIIYRVDVTG